MTCFVISHNLQVQSSDLPALTAAELAAGLKAHSKRLHTAEPLAHPHWLLRLEGDGSAEELADALMDAWRAFRQASGHATEHQLLALGGRKDSDGAPGSPLQKGSWGVDVVETIDADAFLQMINWDGLKQGRPADGVFERRN